MNWSGINVPTAVVLGAAVASLTIVSPVLRVHSEPSTDTKAAISQLEQVVPDEMKKGGVPGVAIAVIRGEKSWSRPGHVAYGSKASLHA